MLNKSDKEIQEARKLHQEAEVLMKTAEVNLAIKMQATENAKKEYENKTKEAVNIRKAYEAKHEELKAERAKLDEVIKQEAERMIRFARGGLIIKYKAKYAAHEGFYIAVLLYGILITLLKGIDSELIRRDVVTAGAWIRKLIGRLWQTTVDFADTVSALSINVPYDRLASVTHGIIYVLVVVIMIAVPIGIVGYGTYRLGKFYYYELWDRVSLAVAMVSIVVIVNFAENIQGFLSVNVLLMVVGMQVVYVSLRKAIW